MNFNIPELRRRADLHLHAEDPRAKRLISAYTMVWAGVYLITNLLMLTISEAYNNLTGLGTLEKGNRLLAISMVASLVASCVTLLLDAGYSAAILRLHTHKDAVPQDLLWGGRNLTRLLLCGLQVFLLTCAVTYAIILPAFMVIPPEKLTVDMMPTPWLMNVTYAICLAALGWFVFNRRLVYFFFAFQQYGGDVAGVRSPVLLLRGCRLQFLRIDLRYWWYYALLLVAMLLPNGSLLLGDAAPSTILIADIVCLLLTVILKSGLFLLTKNQLWTVYAMAFTELMEHKAKLGQEVAAQDNDVFPAGTDLK